MSDDTDVLSSMPKFKSQQSQKPLVSPSSVPVLADFLSNVPPQLTSALVHLAPYISHITYFARLASWTTSWFDSWLALAFWWALCLLAEPTFRYFVPVVVLIVVSSSNRYRKDKQLNPVITEQALQSVIADLTTTQSLLPTYPAFSITNPRLIYRVSAILYLPYLLLTRYVSLCVLVACAGTLILTWRAPWAIVFRAIVWRSAWIRWSVYHIWSWLSGQVIVPPVASFHSASTTPEPGNSLRFLFSVLENQRWWVGLDWTAVLLPGERPSWCTLSQHPVSPPNAFLLPDNTTVFLLNDEGQRVKRTATWKWEEPEWRVLIRKDGAGLSRVERPLPSIKEENSNGSRLLKAAGRLRESGTLTNLSASAGNPKGGAAAADGDHLEEPEEASGEEPNTDIDGWVYGDNKWEGGSSRGGMGKYTRYRQWTRVAVVNETVVIVDKGEVGMERDVPLSRESVISPEGPPSIPTTTDRSPSDESPLRQRLRMALTKNSQS